MSIQKNKEVTGKLNFKAVIDTNEEIEEGMQPDFTQKVSQLNQDYLELQNNANESVEELEREKNERLNILDGLQKDEEYHDEKGNSIPYEMKEKPFGTRKESLSEYRGRVRQLIVEKYEKLKKIALLQKEVENNKKAYYANENSINKVHYDQVENSFSISRKNMMKQGLVQMAKSDLGQEFEEWDTTSAAYWGFLTNLIAYGQASDDHVTKRLGPGEYLDDTENRDKEIDDYIRVRESLKDAIKKAGKDPYLRRKLTGYQKMLDSLADGGLIVPQDAEVYKVNADVIMDKDKVEAKDVIDRRDSPLFAHEPSVRDVEQGGVGDCYLVGTLASLVSVDPQIVKDCMRDNGDGTVTVRFFDRSMDMNALEPRIKSKPVYINVPKKTLGNKGGRNALWVNVFEMAYNGYRRRQKIMKELVYTDFLDDMDLEDQAKWRKKIQDTYNNISKKLTASLPKEIIADGEPVVDCTIVNMVEKMAGKNPRYTKRYKSLLKKKMEENRKAALDPGMIEGGTSNGILDAISGKIHMQRLVHEERYASKMNDLSFVYHHMPKDGEPAAPPTETDALVDRLVDEYLKTFSCAEENKIIMKDSKGAAVEKYRHYMTREQMKNLVDEAKTKDTEQDIRKLLRGFNKEKKGFGTYQRLKDANPALDDVIVESAKKKLLDFYKNADKNTALNYERFSGMYSQEAEKTFEDIKQAAKQRNIITASTYGDLATESVEKGQSGELIFEGIASMHLYSVLGTKTLTVGGVTHKFVRVRNPWGLVHTIYEKDPNDENKIIAKQSMDDTTGGINEVELNHFMERFGKVLMVGLNDVRTERSRDLL